MIDDSRLADAALVLQAHCWVRKATKLLKGKYFINLIRLRINTLPFKAKIAHGRSQKDRSCGVCCITIETTSHILQHCRRYQDGRIERDNHAMSFITKKLRSKGYEVITEPKIQSGQEALKPDILALKNDKTSFIDAQIISDIYPLERAHTQKKEKYNGLDFLTAVANKYGRPDITTTTTILNWI